ncbi:hypothetical protein HHX47_DHR2000537 [Lentinula edodes]|nr:hypothetical protein HHX47_DHR2000537 [Lentinula edodes]
MRCLELAESVAQMSDLIVFSKEEGLGPLDALSKMAGKIRQWMPLPQQPFINGVSGSGPNFSNANNPSNSNNLNNNHSSPSSSSGTYRFSGPGSGSGLFFFSGPGPNPMSSINGVGSPPMSTTALYSSAPPFVTNPSNLANPTSSSVFLPASDIPSFVGKGNVDLGITGHDVILESQMHEHVTEELRLGFGKCALQVQVPEAGSVKIVEDLVDKRVVTSFEVLSGEYLVNWTTFFNSQIDYVGGSVEAACALGLADGIREFLESGDTMRAAGLHAIATVLETEAVLTKSRIPKHKPHSSLINLITIESRVLSLPANMPYVNITLLGIDFLQLSQSLPGAGHQL